MAVPPLARSAPTACLAADRDDALATAMLPSGGNTGQAVLVPATTANPTPSRTTSIAAAVATLAWDILVGGESIEPEQSMMMISALPAPPRGAAIATSAPEFTVTTALTSRPPSGRYWVWLTSTVKPEPDAVMGEFP